jgi:hypothetical protein
LVGRKFEIDFFDVKEISLALDYHRDPQTRAAFMEV